MNRIIINNRTNIGDIYSLELVKKVMEQGKISGEGKKYCYLTALSKSGRKFHVSVGNNKTTDSFFIDDAPN